MSEQTVLDRLKEAFPSEYIGESTTDHRFRFAPRAMIWVRKSNLNIARIWIAQKRRDTGEWRSYLERFPNSDVLRRVIDNPAYGVQRHTTQTKVECLFGSQNVDRLIEALNGRIAEGVREVPDNNVYGYTLRDDFDRIVYVGITNNARARRAEHLLDGKRFAELKIETKPMSRHEAYEWEKRRISGFFVSAGRRPKYNKNFGGNPTTYTAPPRTVTKRPPARVDLPAVSRTLRRLRSLLQSAGPPASDRLRGSSNSPLSWHMPWSYP